MCLECYCVFSWLNSEQITSKIGGANEQKQAKFRGIAAEKNRKLLEQNRLRPSPQLQPRSVLS